VNFFIVWCSASKIKIEKKSIVYIKIGL